MTETRKQYSKEFKLDAISLVHDQGFTRKNGCNQIRAVARFNIWLQKHNFGLKDINHHKIDDFLDYRKKF